MPGGGGGGPGVDWLVLGLQTTVVGMVVVFVVLAILAGVIRLLGIVSGRQAGAGTRGRARAQVVAVAEGETPVSGEVPEEVPEEVAAVIAGAIGAYLSVEGLAGKVVAIRQLPMEAGTPVWSAVGRQELIASRLASSWRKEKGWR